MNKRIIHPLISCALSASLMLSLSAFPALALTGTQSIQVDYQNIGVTLNGKSLSLTDAGGNAVEPFGYNRTVYLPLRAVAGALGLDVDWDNDTATVTLTSGAANTPSDAPPPAGTVGAATIQADYRDIKVVLDGNALTLTDANGNTVEPFGYNRTVYLPLRAVAGALGLDVTWDGASSTVSLAAKTVTGYTGADAQRYVKGTLDEWYLGTYEEQFLEDAGSSPERVQEIYLDSVQVEVESFTYYFGIEYPDDVNDRLLDLFKKICAKTSYTVSSAAGPDGQGVYSVPVTIRPLDIYKLLGEAYPAFSDEFEAAFADVDTEAMTTEAYHEWYVNVYDKAYRDGLCDLLESLIPKIGYLPEQTVTARMESDKTGYYSLNASDNDTLANTIIPIRY